MSLRKLRTPFVVATVIAAVVAACDITLLGTGEGTDAGGQVDVVTADVVTPVLDAGRDTSVQKDVVVQPDVTEPPDVVADTTPDVAMDTGADTGGFDPTCNLMTDTNSIKIGTKCYWISKTYAAFADSAMLCGGANGGFGELVKPTVVHPGTVAPTAVLFLGRLPSQDPLKPNWTDVWVKDFSVARLPPDAPFACVSSSAGGAGGKTACTLSYLGYLDPTPNPVSQAEMRHAFCVQK
jgi:hypothetical protein